MGSFLLLCKLAISLQSVVLGAELVAINRRGANGHVAIFLCGDSQSSPSAHTQAEHASMALDVRLAAVDCGGGGMRLRYI